jgi:hypothetical protein
VNRSRHPIDPGVIAWSFDWKKAVTMPQGVAVSIG